MVKYYLAGALIIAIFLSSCESDNANNKNLPKATGKAGEIIVVIDSATWLGQVGDEIRDVFEATIPTLPRPETLFDLNKIDPANYQSLFQKQKNILIAAVIDDKGRGNRKLRNLFTQESLEMINKDSTLFMYSKKDEYALGQVTLYLFGADETTLIDNIRRNKSKLQQFFLQVEADRQNQLILNTSTEKKLADHIKEKLGCTVTMPFGWDIAVESDNFIWLRSFTQEIDKNIYISWVDYNSEELFSLDSLLKLRTTVTKPYILYKPDDKESYMLTETKNFNVFRDEISFKGLFAVKLQGLWKINKYTMGGPFMSYAMVDENSHRLYYIEAFLYSPGKPQRDLMRELEAILNTFKVAGPPA